MKSAFALLLGALFGAGLILSGMVNPANVQGFLDVGGVWRPQLLAVLGAAVVVTAIFYSIAQRIGHPALGETFYWPTVVVIDRKLMLGAGLFGIGWALAGFCPGPALVALGSLSQHAIIFVVAM